MSSQPLVSIILVNYNGRHLLKNCLTHLFAINYPAEKYEVIVVDNDSQDDSVSYLKKNWPQVKLIESEANLGFAGGNNLGYEHANGEYIVLLNTDTMVEPNWLQALVKTAEPENVGLVNSKLRYHLPFLKLTIKSEIELHANIYQDDNFSPLGIIIENVSVQEDKLTPMIWYLAGFYPPKNGNYTSRWTNGQGELLLPFGQGEEQTYYLTLHGLPINHQEQTQVEFKLGDKVILSDQLRAKAAKQYELTLKREDVVEHLQWLVQNAGNTVFADGRGRDRGSVLKYTPEGLEEFYDFDGPYYNQPADLLAVCGASCLIKRAVIDQVGLFDDAYFMYYEDLDLSLKAWRLGWDIKYCPDSVVYHIHKASTNQLPSKFFMTMVQKNHLLFLLTHFPLTTFAINFLIFVAKSLFTSAMVSFFQLVNYYGTRYKIYSVKAEARAAAWQDFLKNWRHIYQVRKNLAKREVRDYQQLAQKLY